MHPSVVPSPGALGDLVAYVMNNPHLFISSSTVMTTGLLVLAAVVTPLRSRSVVVGRPLALVGPVLFLILAYFGVGSMILATEILMRFHDSIPIETEIQFISGLGHLLAAVGGMAVLAPVVRGLSARRWLEANSFALLYWTLQVLVVRPPWFEFQGQGGEVLAVVVSTLGLGLAATTTAYRRVVR